jgi:hypothetical protein
MSVTAIVGLVGGLAAAVVAFLMVQPRPPERTAAAPEPVGEPGTR